MIWKNSNKPVFSNTTFYFRVFILKKRNNRKVFHATGSSAFTNTLRNILGSRSRPLFKFFNSFMENEKNSIDILVCDEAHRIRKDSTGRYTKRHLRTGRPQIEELIESSKLSISNKATPKLLRDSG